MSVCPFHFVEHSERKNFESLPDKKWEEKKYIVAREIFIFKLCLKIHFVAMNSKQKHIPFQYCWSGKNAKSSIVVALK